MAYDPTTAPLNAKSTEADINSANQWMWQQPWYQEAIKSFGQQMGNVHLNDNQKKQLAQVIAAHGFPLPDRDEIDPSGNVNPKGHKMRNFLIAAAIGGATIATMGAAGAFAGAAGAGGAAGGAGGAAGAAGAGGALAATPTVGAVGSLAGGLASGTAATGAGLSLGGTAAGLGAAGAGLGAALPGSTVGLAGSGLGEAASGLAPLASTTTVPLAGTLPAGVASGTSASGAGVGGGIIQGAKGGSTIANMLKNPDTYSDIGKVLESYGNDEANIRKDRGNWTQQYDRLRLEGEKDRRLAETDALHKLAQTGYLKGGGNPYKPATMLDGSVLPTFGFGPKAPSQAQLEAANTLEGQLLARVQPGAGFQPSPIDSYAKPGKAENIGRYGSYIGTGLGIASKFF